MVRNCLSGAETAAAAESGFLELGWLRGPELDNPEPLSGHILTRPVTQLDGNATSSLRHAVLRPIAGLTERRATLAHAEYVSMLSLGGAELCFAGRSGPDPVMHAHRSGELWDEPGLRLLLARFPEGGTFVDVGAHLGNHAVAVGRLGAAGRIIAVEANDELHRLLAVNLAINGLSARTEITAPGIAIGAAEGEAWLLRNRKRSSESMVKAEAPDDRREGAARIRVITGDALIGETPVDAIKIDTSGSEVEVMRGLSRTFTNQRPVVLVDHSTAGLERIARIAAESGLRVDATVDTARRNRSSSLLVHIGH